MIATFRALKEVLYRPGYLTLASTVSVVSFAFAAWLPNLELLLQVIGDGSVPIMSKLTLPVTLLGSIATNFTVLSASYTIAIAILFGIHVALVTYLLRKRTAQLTRGGVSTGVFGAISGVFGIGCAACGSLLLTGVLPILGTTGLLALLPLGGGELGILGVILLTVALYTTARSIQQPLVCAVT